MDYEEFRGAREIRDQLPYQTVTPLCLWVKRMASLA